ncbi:MAG: hypothetical protein O7G85_17080 [Planctomycetota bacterium]|nr:hypothetical protein [Planctomycetota bacterium]
MTKGILLDIARRGERLGPSILTLASSSKELSMSENIQRRKGLCGFQPCESEVQALIAKAKGHELGTDFLTTGSLEAVAALFETHAFTVDAARRKLNDIGGTMPEIETVATGAGVELNA